MDGVAQGQQRVEIGIISVVCADLALAGLIHRLDPLRCGFEPVVAHQFDQKTVSYTHLTLPTIYSV